MSIPEIRCDLNLGVCGRILLSGTISDEDLLSHDVKPGDRIFITDDVEGAVAIVEDEEGLLFARLENSLFLLKPTETELLEPT